jgi:hypothetical protein
MFAHDKLRALAISCFSCFSCFTLAIIGPLSSACASGGDGDAGVDACVAGVSGTWAGGTTTDCFGMPMNGTATFADCVLTFSDWNMEMSVPTGATIDGIDMQFTGEGWSACTGTLAADGKSFTATCPDAPACDFAMALEE